MSEAYWWLVPRGNSKTKFSMAYMLNWYAANYGYDNTWREMAAIFYGAFPEEEEKDVSGEHWIFH